MRKSGDEVILPHSSLDRLKIASLPAQPKQEPETTMEVKLAQSHADLVRVAPILCELRTQFQPPELIAQIERQQRAGYQLAYVEQKGEVIAAAGFVITEKLAWQRHLYVDDLITSQDHRSSGAGHVLMSWLRDYAIAKGCQQLHLDSGVQRFAAHKFYLREGFIINSHHFSITSLDDHTT